MVVGAPTGTYPVIRPVLIAGSGGMLGTSLQHVAAERGIPCDGPAESAFDIVDANVVSGVVHRFAASNPSGVLVNAAAYTDVERAEDDRDRAFLVNAEGPRLLAVAAREAGLAFVHVSTDFVFDGRKPLPYVETDPAAPLSVYGESKLAGETAVRSEYPEALIVRTAWVFGPGPSNFPLKILRAARAGTALRVVTDEVGSPTYTADLAAALLDLVCAGAVGLFHLAGSASATRYELATETLRLAGIDAPILPVPSDAFQTKAARPRNSVLDCSKASSLGVTMPPWRDSLARYLEALS